MWQNVNGNNTPTEPNSDPGLRITFKPREARVTSTFSPLDAPFIDDLVAGTDTFRYGNLQPSGFRNPTNGSLLMAMTSTRPSWAPPAPTSAVTDASGRNYN